jgi:acetoin utilization deacetylase AcuC-like enzyme
MMNVVFHKDFLSVYARDPAAAAGRMESVLDVIEPYADLVTPEPATDPQIGAVHADTLIDAVKRQGVYRIASLAAGGAVRAAAIGMTQPCFGLIRPPGHHASAGSSWGFCFFNNMAVALQALRDQGTIRRAYVLDIDLHVGDGTIDIFSRRSFVNVFNAQATHRRRYLDEIAREMDICRADIIGISAGFDNHIRDWGGLLKTADYETIGRRVHQAAVRNGGGCFAVLEGGYNQEVLGDNVLALMTGMGGV